MHENENLIDKDPVGNLTDFVSGCTKDNPLHIEVAVNDAGKVVVFHDKPFKTPISWFEFDLDSSRLQFIMGDGDIRDAGLTLVTKIKAHMQNAHQILTIFMDDSTGEAEEGQYIPLIIHRV